MVLNVIWGLMPHMLLPPNAFLRALWDITKQFIPALVPTHEVQLQLSSLPQRYTGDHLVRIANQMQIAAQIRGHESRHNVLQKVSITAATSTALGRMGKPLRPYKASHLMQVFPYLRPRTGVRRSELRQSILRSPPIKS